MNSRPDNASVIRRKLLDYLFTFITENKRSKFEQLVLQRTRHMTIVLEDIYQPHNASAVLRSCDCFGIQDVHIIENENTYEVNPDVALGSSKWLNLYKYNEKPDNTADCLNSLKEKGYRIIATTPHTNDFTPDTFPLEEKFALVFGTELKGLTPAALAHADGFIRIPMYGFTESFNISVSAALLLYGLSERLRSSSIPWRLSDEEIREVQIQWAMNAIRKGEVIARDFLEKLQEGKV
jgi:tRNA (guanosine-2'-O-)-methyltransferase